MAKKTALGANDITESPISGADDDDLGLGLEDEIEDEAPEVAPPLPKPKPAPAQAVVPQPAPPAAPAAKKPGRPAKVPEGNIDWKQVMGGIVTQLNQVKSLLLQRDSAKSLQAAGKITQAITWIEDDRRNI